MSIQKKLLHRETRRTSSRSAEQRSHDLRTSSRESDGSESGEKDHLFADKLKAKSKPALVFAIAAVSDPRGNRDFMVLSG